MVIFLLLPLRGRESDNFRESNEVKEQRTDTINEAKKIKSDNSTRIYREKSNIAIA